MCNLNINTEKDDPRIEEMNEVESLDDDYYENHPEEYARRSFFPSFSDGIE
jgi:hypothetical protein